MLSKRLLAYIGAAAAGTVIAYFIAGWLTAPPPTQIIPYSHNYTVQEEQPNETTPTITFNWDYLDLASGEEYFYSLNCSFCFNDTLRMTIVDAVNDDLSIDFDVMKIMDLNETITNVTILLSLETTKSSLLTDLSTASEDYFIYIIFLTLFDPSIMEEVAWTELTVDRPINFMLNSLNHELTAGDQVVVNGFNCYPVDIKLRGNVTYHYCLSPDFGMPVVAEHYPSPDFTSFSLKLLSHQV